MHTSSQTHLADLIQSADAADLIDQLHAQAIDISNIAAFFDARGLACPMPLLKAKVALKSVPEQRALYLLASDKNSQTDLVAFCQKNHFGVQTWQSGTAAIYHFIITKSNS